MKSCYQYMVFALLLLPFGSGFTLEATAEPQSQISPQDGMTEQQREQIHQMMIEQRKKIKADHDAALRQQRAAELKEETQRR